MRTSFFTILILSFCLSIAQTTPKKSSARLSFGFHGGVNAGKFQTEMDSSDVSARIGWQAGGLLRYGGRFFLQTKLNLGQSTMNIVEVDTSLLNIQSKIRRSFVTIPLSLGLKIIQSPDGKSSLNFSAGVEAMSILKTDIDENLFYLKKDDFEPFSWAAVGCFELNLWLFRFDLGVHYGLTPMLKDDENSKNIMGTFNVGIIF